jgi:hypothetical protein
MRQKKITIKISVLLEQEDHYWVAQGLEYDIAAQGKNISEAKKSFGKTIISQIVLDLKDNLKPLEGIEKAPQMYWDMFKKAERLKEQRSFAMPKSIPSPFMIDAIAKDLRIAA